MINNEELAALSDGADELEQGIRGVIALGGAKKGADVERAITELHNAHLAIEGNRAADAREATLRGQFVLESLVDERGFLWRLVNVHQVPLFLYHVAFFLAFIAAGITCTECTRFAIIPRAVLGDTVPMLALLAGGLGAELRGIWFLWHQTSERLYHRRFLLAQLAAPFTGVLLGMLTFLLIKAGLLVIATPSTASADLAKVTVGELAICFFVGFKWEWALKRIEAAFTGATGQEGDEKPDPDKPRTGQGGEPPETQPTKTSEHPNTQDSAESSNTSAPKAEQTEATVQAEAGEKPDPDKPRTGQGGEQSETQAAKTSEHSNTQDSAESSNTSAPKAEQTEEQAADNKATT
ncbi:MAG TPA: hypothetical protein VES88_12255 [Gemmatimonadaceae bacterium]|nr:hypothetical protein [Gemmatimonadaceae bacterium]